MFIFLSFTRRRRRCYVNPLHPLVGIERSFFTTYDDIEGGFGEKNREETLSLSFLLRDKKGRR